ncbi:MAG: AraC family transcriptional regulator [Lachnospiraceae bacterium]|nr:AraC family transcriptional regulator [uncultured Acetatifactor sp.]MCI9229964.1 AraC family transcriptional regulator [Lachnospiraceae bacterium]
MTFNDYLNFRRLKAAAGFPSISTFNRLFKSAKQCTPSEYRSDFTTAP